MHVHASIKVIDLAAVILWCLSVVLAMTATVRTDATMVDIVWSLLAATAAASFTMSSVIAHEMHRLIRQLNEDQIHEIRRANGGRR